MEQQNPETRTTTVQSPHVGPHYLSQRLDDVVGALEDLSGAVREHARALAGDPQGEEHERPYTVYFTIEHGGESFRRVTCHRTIGKADESPQEAVRNAYAYLLAVYGDPEYYGENDEIPFGEVRSEDITLHHVLTLEDGYPVIVDPEEYAAGYTARGADDS